MEVRAGQKFCMECGASLRGVADTTGEVPLVRPNRALSDDARDEVTRAMGTAPPSPPAPGDVTTPMRRELPAPAQPTPTPTPMRREPAARDWQHDPYATIQMPRATEATDPDRTAVVDRRAETATTRVPTASRSAADQDDREVTTRTTAVLDDPWALAEPAAEGRAKRHPFRLRTMFVLAALAGGATSVGVLTDLVSITPETDGAPFEVGTWMVNDFGTNNAIGGLIAAAVMVVGAFLWCFGVRWGAGLAGGAGTALAGWSALMIGLAEYPLFRADAVAASDPAELTRDIGYWAVAAAGGIGLLVLGFSFVAARRDRSGGLDPWIAALGAASFVVAAGGPLIPLGPAEISANYSSETLATDLPALFFAGRLVQLGLLALFGILGFLIVRRYGLGLAIGAAVTAGWMLITAATEQTDSPIGPAFANPGATAGDMGPHGVTIVGMALVGFFALVAVGMALLDTDRRHSQP